MLRRVRQGAVGQVVVPSAQRKHRDGVSRPPRAGRVRDTCRALLPQPDAGPGPLRARPRRRTPDGAEPAVPGRPRPGQPATGDDEDLRLALAGDARPVPAGQGPPVVHRQRAGDRADSRPGHDPATARGALLVVRSRARDSRALHTGPGRCADLLVGCHRCGAMEPGDRLGCSDGAIGASPNQDVDPESADGEQDDQSVSASVGSARGCRRTTRRPRRSATTPGC